MVKVYFNNLERLTDAARFAEKYSDTRISGDARHTEFKGHDIGPTGIDASEAQSLVAHFRSFMPPKVIKRTIQELERSGAIATDSRNHILLALKRPK